MGHWLILEATAGRFDATEWGSGFSKNKSPKRPKKTVSGKSASTTAFSGRCLMQPGDIQAAIAWRIEGIPNLELKAIAALLRPLAERFSESDPEVSALLADLRRPGDRRGPWSLACAILADDAARREDWSLFWSAGIEVLHSLRQGQRSNQDRNPLTSMMRTFKSSHAKLTSEQAFEHFASIAEMTNGTHDALACYSSSNDALVLHGAHELSRESFCRQYRRL